MKEQVFLLFNLNFFTFCVVVFLISSTNCEILQLRNATHVHCINDDNDSTFFIIPPLRKLQSNSESIKEEVEWHNDDWTVKSSTDIPITAVTDRRWEDFSLIKNDYNHFNFSGSASISVLSPAIIEIYTFNENSTGIYEIFNLKESAKWYHFSVISKNNRILFYKNAKVEKNRTDFEATELVFRSRNTTFWKVHEYNFRWSDTATDNNPTLVKIPATGKSCLLLYTTLCNDCTLQVNTTKETRIIYSENKETELEYWQTDKIEIEPDRENYIAIYRKHNGNGNGFWAIDIGTCDSHNIVSYRIPSETSKSTYTCSSLSNHHHHEKYSTNLANKIKSSCDPEEFNEKCRFNCDKVFGEKHPLCEDYQFCHNSKSCICTWRHKGLDCQESGNETEKLGYSNRKDSVISDANGLSKSYKNLYEGWLIMGTPLLLWRI